VEDNISDLLLSSAFVEAVLAEIAARGQKILRVVVLHVGFFALVLVSICVSIIEIKEAFSLLIVVWINLKSQWIW